MLKLLSSSINYGIKTGCNAAFIIDNETKEALIAEDPKSAEIIKPVLRGRDIKRYQTNWAKLWLIDTHNGYSNVSAISIDEYPAVKNHLDQFYPELKERQDQGVTPYNLRNCAYHAEFEKEKIVWSDISIEPSFSLLDKDFYVNNTTYMMNVASKYILGVLNSKITRFYFPLIASGLGSETSRYFKQFVVKIPIPRITNENESIASSIENLTKQIVTLKRQDFSTDTDCLEARIDQFVYKLYALNADEIRLLDSKD